MAHHLRALVAACAAVLVLVPAAYAADPGRWKLAQADALNIDYFQGLTHGPGAQVFFDGPAQGFYRTSIAFKQA
ncbi:MAG: hypothetical protein QOF12_1263, partial [Solirubrobacteraceae bacterium]|nr:hypothetical protein [Solirubrobacteraceae bacterium]